MEFASDRVRPSMKAV